MTRINPTRKKSFYAFLICFVLLICVPLGYKIMHSGVGSEEQIKPFIVEDFIKEGEEFNNKYSQQVTSYIEQVETPKVTTLEYVTEQETAIIKDDVGSEIIRSKLLTPQVVIVPQGYQKVAEFTIENNIKVLRAIENIEVYKKKTMTPTNRVIDYKYWHKTGERVLYDAKPCTPTISYETQKRQGTKEAYSYYDNNTKRTVNVPSTPYYYNETIEIKDYSSCQPKPLTYETGEWLPFNNLQELPVGNIRIGLFMHVKKDDYLEWIPTIAGQRIVQWATIQEGIWRGTQRYYSFNETAGDGLPELTTFGSNGSNTDGSNWVTGKLGNALNYTGTEATEIGNFSNTAEFSYSFWVKPNTLSQTDGAGIFYANKEEFGVKINNTNQIFVTSGGISFYADTLASGNFSLTNWTHIIVTSNSTTLSYYRNGLLISQATGTTGSGNRNMTFSKIVTITAIEDNEGVNVTLGGTPATDPCSGMLFDVGSTPISVVRVEKYAGNGATLVCVAESGAVCIQNSTYSGNFATFSPPVALSPSTSYEILNHGSFTSKFANAGGYPKVRDYVTWTGSRSTACGGPDTTNAFDFVGMDVSIDTEQSVNFSGSIDEFGFWNRTLSSAEIEALHNSFSGLSYGDSVISTTLNVPVNNFNSTLNSLIFNCSATAIGTINNLSLIIDGVGNYSINPGSSSASIERNVSLSGSVHTWTCNATDTNSFTSQSTERTFTIDPVDLDLNVPANNFNSSTQTVNFNCTANSTANLENITLKIDGVNNYSLTGIGAKTRSISTNQSVSEGNHEWTCLAFDVNGFNKTSTVRYFGVDSTLPIISGVTSNATIISYTATNNLTLNFTATDTNIGTVWVDYNGTNLTAIGSGTSYGLNFGVNTTRNQTFIIYANDTYGNENRSTAQTFQVYYIQYSLLENRQSLLEGETANFTLYLNTTSIPVSTARLVWNNTDYGLGLRTKVDNDSYKFTKGLVVPAYTGNATGNLITYYWNYTMLGVKNDTLTDNQTIISVNLGQCNGTYTQSLINYSLVDEETKSATELTNTSIEVDVQLTSTDGTFQWNFSTNTTENNLTICIQNFTNGSNLYLYSTARYKADLHVYEYDYIQKKSLTYGSLNTFVYLYDLASADSTSFITSFKDSVNLPVENAIIEVWRKYVGEGIFRAVEDGKTNDVGETVLHLVTEDVIYQFLVRKDNVLLFTSPEYQVTCQTTPCQLNFFQSQTLSKLTNFSTIDNLDYNIALNKNTRTATLTYSTIDGSAVLIGFNVTLLDNYGNNTVCASTETSSGGTITCTIPENYDNSTYYIEVYKDGQFATYRLFNLNIDFGGFGDTGTIMTFVLVLTLGLMALGNPIIAIILMIIGIVMATSLAIFNGGSIFGLGSSVIWLICAGGILIWKMSRSKLG